MREGETPVEAAVSVRGVGGVANSAESPQSSFCAGESQLRAGGPTQMPTCPAVQKGLEALRGRPLPLPASLRKCYSNERPLPPDPDAEVRLHVLRLVQSVVLEPEVVAAAAPELRSSLPLQRIRALSESRNPRLQAAARELLEDLHALGRDA